MRWWPRKPVLPDPPLKEDPPPERPTVAIKCALPGCVNDVPPDRESFCSDECLKAYSASATGRIRGLRTLRGYTYQSRQPGSRAEGR
jgi:hypothetical protein